MLIPEPLTDPGDGITLKSLRHLVWRSFPQTVLLLLGGERVGRRLHGKTLSYVQDRLHYLCDPLQNENAGPLLQNF